jgi:hypothetical protein
MFDDREGLGCSWSNDGRINARLFSRSLLRSRVTAPDQAWLMPQCRPKRDSGVADAADINPHALMEFHP